MKNIYVCLVSEHTPPNILPVAELEPDELLLISTAEMEKKNKSAHIINCLKNMGHDYSEKSSVIEVIEDSITDCQRKVADWLAGREDADFVVNLTGGTKIMSIATFEQFKDYGSSMFYIPIRRNEMTGIFPKRTSNRITSLNQRLSVADYLLAYGLVTANAAKIETLKQEAAEQETLAAWIVKYYSQLKNILRWLGGALRSHRDDKKPYLLKDSFEVPNHTELKLLEKAGFTLNGNIIEKELTKTEIQFLTGGWLEVFCFNEINRLYGNGIDDVVTGIAVKNAAGTSNEFDVMFTKDNALYTVECKSGDQHDDLKTDALYKVAALQKEFGLQVNSFFVSTSPNILKDGKVKASIAARAEQFRTTIVPPDDVCRFGEILKERLKL